MRDGLKNTIRYVGKDSTLLMRSLTEVGYGRCFIKNACHIDKE